MEQTVQFYYCEVCGNIVELIKNNKGRLVCCGKPMSKMIADTTDAALEKHVPIVTRVEDTLHIEVGSIHHPMTDEHLIEWLVVTDGVHTERVHLSAGADPVVVIPYRDDVEVYAYCNLHGLWKSK